MSGRKRAAVSTSEQSSQPKKREITVETVQKWIRDNDKELNTSVWLHYVKSDQNHVDKLKCSVCVEFQGKLQGMRNYNAAFIDGSKNLRASSFKDHAATEMHTRAMQMFKRKSSSDIAELSPIIRALHNLDKDSEMKLKRKFEIAYFISKENLSFTKMGPLCELMERQGTDLGQGYKNNQACSVFIDYIAKEQQQVLVDALKQATFFSVQADGSTDVSNAEEELYLVLYFDPYAKDGKVHVRNKFLTIRQPKSTNAAGLYESFKNALSFVGITDWEHKLIGFECAGANVNIAAGGLRGYLEQSVPWVGVFWCLAHRLELSLKDALSGTLFSTVDNMLMRVYYLYENSPKKCRDLNDIVAELKACLQPSDMPVSGGNRPVRACGTRFIAHKVAALERLVNRFGAYLNHLAILSEDPSIKSTDKHKLKGYLLQWRNAKMLYACAMFHDLLKPAATLCKVMQYDEISIVEAIEAVMKSSRTMEKLMATNFHDLPTVKKISAALKRDENGSYYQEAKITNLEDGVAYLQEHKDAYIAAIQACLKDRVKVQSIELLTHAMTILAPNGWEKTKDASFAYEALDSIASRFRVPLEKSNVDCSLLQEEWDDMVDYAKRYLNLVQEEHQVLWWKLFNAVDAVKWKNILAVVELLFCLPMSNGRVERLFSLLKIIKTEKRACLGDDRLHSLMQIASDSPPLSKWDASNAVKLWWGDKKRRQVQDSRAPVSSTSAEKSTDGSCSSEESYTVNLADWEDWLSTD